MGGVFEIERKGFQAARRSDVSGDWSLIFSMAISFTRQPSRVLWDLKSAGDATAMASRCTEPVNDAWIN